MKTSRSSFLANRNPSWALIAKHTSQTWIGERVIALFESRRDALLAKNLLQLKSIHKTRFAVVREDRFDIGAVE